MTKKLAFIFPGQGSQCVGMGKDVAEAHIEARQVFEEVDDALSFNLSKLIFEGPIEDLTKTEHTQPALMATSIAILRVLEAQGNYDLAKNGSYVAGHSLGEYTALCAAKAISLSDTAKLLQTRGQAMQAAVPLGEGGMGALIGVDLDAAETIANEAAEGEALQVANDNSPGQIVLSGTAGAIARVEPVAKAHGAKRFIPLNVSAPFHSVLMQPAAEKMEEALKHTEIKAPSLPLIANVTAQAVTKPDDITALLVKQVTERVRWRETIAFMAENDVEKTVEIGAGKVLSGLTKRIHKEMNAMNISSNADIEALLEG